MMIIAQLNLNKKLEKGIIDSLEDYGQYMSKQAMVTKSEEIAQLQISLELQFVNEKLAVINAEQTQLLIEALTHRILQLKIYVKSEPTNIQVLQQFLDTMLEKKGES